MLEPGNFQMPFGKYKGETLSRILELDKPYLEWCIQNLHDEDLVDRIQFALDDFNMFSRHFRY